METILQGVMDLDGVLAVLAINGTGQIAAYQANSIYDVALLRQTARLVAKSVDSIQLLREDWENVAVNYRDGRLLLRNLVGKDGPPKNGLVVMAVVADTRLNLSFAGVALRVAISKLKNATLGAGPLGTSSMTGGATPVIGQTSPMLSGSNANAAPPSIATSGLSWSGLSGSVMGASGVVVADTASANYLSACTTALAKCVGPLAKAVVKETVQRLWPNRPFSRDLAPALIAELETHIDSDRARLQFRNSIKAL